MKLSFLPAPIFKMYGTCFRRASISFAGENCQLLRMMDDLRDIFITRRRRCRNRAVTKFQRSETGKRVKASNSLTIDIR